MGILGKAIITSSSKKKTVLEKLGAVFAIDAAKSIPGEQWVLNRGSGGQVLRAKYGSVARGEIRNGVGLVLPGVVGNSAGIPYSATMIPTTSLSLRAVIQPDAAVPSSDNDIISLWTTGGTDRAYRLSIDTAGSPVFVVSSSGSSTTATGTAPAPGFANGVAYSIRADWTASPAQLNIYTKATTGNLDDDTGWTLLGGPFTASVPSSIFNSAESVRIGRHAGTSYFGGVIKGALIKVDGVKRLDVDFTAQPDLTSSFTCTTGQTVTVTAANAVDTNDPLWLPWNGENYVWVEAGGATNVLVQYQSFTGATSMRVETDQEINWSTVGQVNLIDVANLPLVYHQGGALICRLSLNSTYLFPQVTHGITGSRREKIAVECDISAGWVDFFRWVNGAWTQIGTRQTFTPNAWTNANSNQTALVGASSTANKFYSWKVVSGGTTVCELYAADATSGSVTTIAARAGATASVLRATSGRKTAVVTRPIWLLGTDDYLEVADNALLDFGATDDFTVLLVGRIWGTPAANGRLIDKSDPITASPGWTLYTIGSDRDVRLYMFGAVSVLSIGLPQFDSGSLNVWTGAANRTSQLAWNGQNTSVATGVDVSGVGSVATTGALRIGNRAVGARPQDMEVLAAGIFRRALSAAEIAQIVSAYRAG